MNILPVGSTLPCDIFALGLLGCSLISGKEISSWGAARPVTTGVLRICLPLLG